ncbi:MAG TPA: sialidase family protein [Woeseiaceae bacterium]|nr:sialidase family protein [Woeseiaceae bacterium]
MHSNLFRRCAIPTVVLAGLVFGGCTEDTAAPDAAGLPIQPLETGAAPGSLGPKLSSGAGGALVLSWVEPLGAAHRLRYSRFTGGAWSEPRTAAAGEDWFVNWADFPSVVPLSDSLWAAHWLASQPAGGYAYDVLVSLSQDGGANWSAPVKPHDDGTPTEHGFVTLFPSGSATGVVWLDGRQMATAAKAGEIRGMTLRAATLAADRRIGNEAVIDDLTCDCCQTDVATTTAGAIAVYRDRTEEETRDIYTARLVNGAWQPGEAVADDGWTIGGCPVNGPVIEADGERVAIAWFTAADEEPRVRVASSGDAGRTFSAPIDMASRDTSGHVGLALLPENGLAVSWTCGLPDGNTGVCLRALSGTGEPGPLHVLTGDAHVPTLSVPQLARHGDVLVAAWTEKAGGDTTIASARFPIASLR